MTEAAAERTASQPAGQHTAGAEEWEWAAAAWHAAHQALEAARQACPDAPAVREAEAAVQAARALMAQRQGWRGPAGLSGSYVLSSLFVMCLPVQCTLMMTATEAQAVKTHSRGVVHHGCGRQRARGQLPLAKHLLLPAVSQLQIVAGVRDQVK
jgi:hypothetical protein